jgi:hypothetical protein
MHRADYRLFPDLRIICIIYSGDIDGDEITEHIAKIMRRGDIDRSWNCVVDLRSFIGDIHHSSLARMATLINGRGFWAPHRGLPDKSGARVSIVSYNAGQRFLVNLARVYIQGYDLRHFTDMRQGFAWASGCDALPPGMASLDWHLTEADAGGGVEPRK